MDKEKTKRHEILVYLFLVALAVILGFVSAYYLTSDTWKGISLNLASELLAVAILFLLINRLFLPSDEREIPSKILAELESLKLELRKAAEEERQRQKQKIKVVLNCSDREIELPVEIRRAEFTRGEILGRIGMIPMKVKSERFSLRYTNNPKFIEQIHQILDGEKDAILTIPCDEAEMNQFDLESGRK